MYNKNIFKFSFQQNFQMTSFTYLFGDIKTIDSLQNTAQNKQMKIHVHLIDTHTQVYSYIHWITKTESINRWNGTLFITVNFGRITLKDHTQNTSNDIAHYRFDFSFHFFIIWILIDYEIFDDTIKHSVKLKDLNENWFTT